MSINTLVESSAEPPLKSCHPLYILLLSSLKGEGEPRFPPFSEWIGERTGLIAIKEGVSLMAREPLFDTRKRPSPNEKSVSFILLKALIQIVSMHAYPLRRW